LFEEKLKEPTKSFSFQGSKRKKENWTEKQSAPAAQLLCQKQHFAALT